MAGDSAGSSSRGAAPARRRRASVVGRSRSVRAAQPQHAAGPWAARRRPAAGRADRPGSRRRRPARLARHRPEHDLVQVDAAGDPPGRRADEAQPVGLRRPVRPRSCGPTCVRPAASESSSAGARRRAIGRPCRRAPLGRRAAAGRRRCRVRGSPSSGCVGPGLPGSRASRPADCGRAPRARPAVAAPAARAPSRLPAAGRRGPRGALRTGRRRRLRGRGRGRLGTAGPLAGGPGGLAVPHRRTAASATARTPARPPGVAPGPRPAGPDAAPAAWPHLRAHRPARAVPARSRGGAAACGTRRGRRARGPPVLAPRAGRRPPRRRSGPVGRHGRWSGRSLRWTCWCCRHCGRCSHPLRARAGRSIRRVRHCALRCGRVRASSAAAGRAGPRAARPCCAGAYAYESSSATSNPASRTTWRNSSRR